jgi:hypothetical protein
MPRLPCLCRQGGRFFPAQPGDRGVDAAYGYIKENWQQAVDLYTRQCSVGVNAKDLAMMAAIAKTTQ